MDQPESDGVRILSFDGGDISAVSQLIILDEFMQRVKWDQKSTTRILPCEYFHMMAGVGTGGIIVFLLALLRMGTREAIEEFEAIWLTVFADSALDQVTRSERLEDSIKNLLKKRNMEEDRKMYVEDEDGGYQVFVCAVSESDLGHCEKFRNYRSGETSLNPTMVQAVRASCAIPALFKPVRIEVTGAQVSYISGTYNFNNPTGETIKEACEHFGRDRPVACVLSLGCGQRKSLRVPESSEENEIIDLVEEIASDCERVARELGWRIGKSNVYYRLSDNIQVGYENGSSRDLIGNIVQCTQSFLHHHNISTIVDECVEACKGFGGVTLMEICELSSIDGLWSHRSAAGVSENKAGSAHGLPFLSAFFVERQGIVKEMARGLFRSRPSTQRRMVISGLGGIGKTQVTISFLLQFLSRFRHVLFVDGSSIQSIESGIVAKVKSLGATYSRTSANEALEVLTYPDYEITRDWAIVYDNVDDPEIPITDYFPQCEFGTLIITTRNPSLGNLAPGAHIQLDIVSEKHAIEILLRSVIQPPLVRTQNDYEHARGIAKALGYLPVALVQAGYFINLHGCMSDYLQRLETRRPQILSRPAKAQLDKHYHGVYASLDVTWPVLSSRAQRFLSTLGFVNYTGLPLELIYRAAKRCFLVEPFQLLDRPQEFDDSVDLLCEIFRSDEEYDASEQDVDDIVAELETYSLIARMETFKLKTLRFHPLVQSWIYDRLSPQERGVYQAAAVRLLVCGTGDHDQDVDIFEFAYPHVALLSDRLGRLHVNDRAGLAAIFAHHGDVKTAAELWEGIYHDLVKSYGENHLLVSVAQLQLAGVQGKFNDDEKKSNALRLESKALELRARKLGPDHPMTIHAFAQMARGVARNRISKPMVVVALFALFNVMERHPSDSWDDIPQSKEVWASAVGIFSKTRAIDGWTAVLEERKEKKGLNHYTTMRAAEALAAAYDSNGTEDSAESDWSLGWVAEPSRGNPATGLWIDLVEEKRRRRGPQHPDTLRTIEGLARAYLFQNLASLSVDRWKEVITLRQEAQGHSHEETLDAMEQLAKKYASCGQYDEAQQLWRSVAALRKQANGARDKSTVKVMAHSAITYEQCEQYEKAEAEWKEIIRMGENESPTGQNTLYAMEKLARMYTKSGRKTEAVSQWNEVVGMLQEAKGPWHKDTLEAMTELGRAYALCEHYNKAEAQWEKVIELSRVQSSQGSHTRRAINAIEALANLCEERGQDEKAVEWWREAIGLRKEAKTRFHKQRPDALEHLRQLLDVFSGFKRFANPEGGDRKLASLFREFIAPGNIGLFAPGNSELLAPGNKGLLFATLRLAKVCSRSGRYDEAKPILAEAKFKIREGIYDDINMDSGIGELLEHARTLLAKFSGIDAGALRDMPLEGEELEYAERRSARGTLSKNFPHLDADLIDNIFELMGRNLESTIEALERME